MIRTYPFPRSSHDLMRKNDSITHNRNGSFSNFDRDTENIQKIVTEDAGLTVLKSSPGNEKERRNCLLKSIYVRKMGRLFTNSRDYSPLILRVHWFSGMPFIILS